MAVEQPSFFAPFAGVDLRTHKSIRLAAAGDVALTELETRIIDTRAFQRLRAIRQLGTAYLVFPTALHTRFDHSLGTLAMACEMIRAIRENRRSAEEQRRISPEQEQLARIYALIHDVGHLPFGHTLEDEFRIFPRHDGDAERIGRFFGPESEIGAIIRGALGSELYDRLFAIIRADRASLAALGEDAFIYDLVSNTVCADLLDYLRRDSFFCAIALDLDYRFLNYLYLHREGKAVRAAVRVWKEDNAGPRRDVLTELVRLLDNRYLLGERVYFHHTKLVAGAMVAGAVARAAAEGEISKDDLYELGDETLLECLAKSKVESARRLARAVRERRLWKLIARLDRSGVRATSGTGENESGALAAITARWHSDAAGRVRAEDEIARALGLEPGDSLVHCPSAEMQMKLAETPVFWNGELRPLRECREDPIVGAKLELILKSHESLWAIRACLNPERLGQAGEARGEFEKRIHHGVTENTEKKQP